MKLFRHMNRKGMAAMAAMAALMAFSTASAKAPETAADLVVYGKVYTANADARYADAFAVKDGKYIYVGNKEGAKAYIDSNVTKVIDRTGKGMIMPGATEGHGHYMTGAAMGHVIHLTDTIDETIEFLKEHVAKYPNEKMYLTYGWCNEKLLDVKDKVDMRSKIDAVCPDKIVVMIDDTGHNIYMNSKALEAAGIDGNTKVEGGEFSKDANGRLLGLATDVAMNYAMGPLVRDSGYMSSEAFGKAAPIAENLLHAFGYTNYFDAYISYFGEAAYKGLADYDKNVGLTVVVGGSYKMDPFEDENEIIDRAAEYQKKYSTKHFKPSWIKLFGDGECTESLSGWVKTPYKSGSTGNQVWDTDRFNAIVKKANEKGVSIHVHASGDGATEQAVNAFIAAEDTAAPGVLNALGHSRHITEETLDKMAEHNIYSATNINWRGLTEIIGDTRVPDNFDEKFYWEGYPMKKQVSRGIKMTSSTDYPADSGAPCDILNIMELAVNDSMDPKFILEGREMGPFDKSDELTVEEALDVLTINGAYQMGIEKERGSIEKGKYADFLFISKDITTIPKDEIHTAEISDVYFEGEEVYKK